MVLAEAGVPVSEIHVGRYDRREPGSTQMEKLFNVSTVEAAGLWVYRHPDDERFLPEALPDASPVTMQMAGGPREFSGEPLSAKRSLRGSLADVGEG
jgi:hypothetical protein